jgi:hypothetical protein
MKLRPAILMVGDATVVNPLVPNSHFALQPMRSRIGIIRRQRRDCRCTLGGLLAQLKLMNLLDRIVSGLSRRSA